MLGAHLNEVSDFYGRFRAVRPPAFDKWRLQQAQRERSYLTKLNDWGQKAALLMVHSADDHARALRHALSDPKELRIWAYLTLSRATVEACVRAAYLSDCEATPATRVLRAAGVHLDECREQIKLAKVVADGPALIRAEQDSERVVLLCQRAGITIRRDRRDLPIVVSRGGERANVGVNVTEESEKRLDDLPMAYRLGSASTHAGTWLLSSAIGSLDGKTYPRPDPDVIVSAVIATLCGLEALAAATRTGPEFVQIQQHRIQRIASVLTELYEGHPRS